MAVRPEIKPSAKVISQHAEEDTKRAIVAQAAGKKSKKAPPLIAKLQSLIPALMLWRMRIAAANDQQTLNQWLRKVLARALRDYDYPTIPESLKAMAESEKQSSQAA
jgi:hypothetical protein